MRPPLDLVDLVALAVLFANIPLMIAVYGRLNPKENPHCTKPRHERGEYLPPFEPWDGSPRYKKGDH
jgi:hypothetical protein